MQNPVDFGKTILADALPRDLRNILREYLQVMTLKILYRSPEGQKLGFGGGTALRLCHNLPRYSEDLDFEQIKPRLALNRLVTDLKTGFRQFNTPVEIAVPKTITEKTVAKLWLRFPRLLAMFNLTSSLNENLSLKVEIDTKPPKGGHYEPVYVTKFNEYFPITVSALPTSFANKIGAIAQRKYLAPRDFYDLVWYLNKKIEPNYAVLKRLGIPVTDRSSLIKVMDFHGQRLAGKSIFEAMGNFLENEEQDVIHRDFAKVYQQAAKRYLE